MCLFVTTIANNLHICIVTKDDPKKATQDKKGK